MKTIARPFGILAMISAAALVLGGMAEASAPPVYGPSATCNAANNHSFGPLFNDAWVFSSTPPVGQGTTVTQALASPIAPGTYDLVTVAWDGHAQRIAQGVQPFEIYFLELLDADGNVLATSGATTDVADLVLEAEWSGSIGQVSWTGVDATQVRVVHGNIGYPDYQSIHATCFGWTPVQVETTATTTTTTTIATTTTTTVPVDSSTETTVPVETTTTTTTTTSIPTEVLTEIAESQSAEPVQGAPTFTG